MRTPWTWAAGAASIIMTIVACTTPPLPNLDSQSGRATVDDHTAPDASAKPRPADGGTGTASAAPKPPAPTPAECKSKMDGNSCVDCCDAAFADFVAVQMKQYFDCLCAPGACRAACASTRCNGAPLPSPSDPNTSDDALAPDPACDACESGTPDAPGKGTACTDAVLNATATNPAQKGWTDCVDACPAPPGADGDLADGGAESSGGGG